MKGFKNAAGRNAKAIKDEHGNRFDSMAEMRRWYQLQLLEKSGAIRNLERQVRIALYGRDAPILTPTGKQMNYVADYVYDENGERVIEDCKGHASEVYAMKKAILAAQGIKVRETKG